MLTQVRFGHGWVFAIVICSGVAAQKLRPGIDVFEVLSAGREACGPGLSSVGRSSCDGAIRALHPSVAAVDIIKNSELPDGCYYHESGKIPYPG